jgi:sugar lactone lactonase YvrE
MDAKRRNLLSRRDVLTGFGALGATAAIVGLAGCSSNTGGDPSVTTTGTESPSENAAVGENSPKAAVAYSLSNLIDPDSEWEKVVSVGEGAFIEGINFDQNGQMWFTDVIGHRIFTVIDDELEVAYEDDTCSPSGAKFIDEITLLIMDSVNGIGKFNTLTREYEKSIITEFEGSKFNNLNDIALDGNGFAYITETAGATYTKRISKVFRLDIESLELVVHEDNIAFANGIAVGPDGNIYIVESLINQVLVSPPSGGASMLGTRVFARYSGGVGPDGIDIDSMGNVWAVIFQASEIKIVAPDGREYDGSLRLPESAGLMPTNLAFNDGYVYVTESMLNEVWRIPVKV